MTRAQCQPVQFDFAFGSPGSDDGEFEYIHGVAHATPGCDDAELGGRSLKVNEARPKSESRGGGRSRW